MVLGTYFVRDADMTRCEEDVRKLERHLQELKILYDLITDLITGITDLITGITDLITGRQTVQASNGNATILKWCKNNTILDGLFH